MPVLTMIDALGVQGYVFASNRLRDVIGGSRLVTRQLGDKALGQAGAEDIIFAAGGNALLRFPDAAAARLFARRFSRELLEQAPGLEIAVAHVDYEPGQLGRAIQRLQVRIQQAKLARRPHAPLLGLGVTAHCAETRLPAALLRQPPGGGEPEAVSLQVDARRSELESGDRERWREFLPDDWRERVDFPLDLDNLGRSAGEISLIGVAHIDGNGIGKALADWLQARLDLPDQQLAAEYKAVSGALDGWAAEGLRAVMARLCGALREIDGRLTLHSERLGRGFPLVRKGGKHFLPLRPVLLGGDDLTFLCDGRVALDLAAEALRAMAAHPIPALGGQRTAAAGIAIVRSHTPFGRAYELAEALCASAKRGSDAVRDQSALDWHAETSVTAESLVALRHRAYRTVEQRPDGEPYALTARPLRLGEAGDKHSWTWLDQAVLGADGGFNGGFWNKRRNKMKALQEALAYGKDEAERSLRAWGLQTKLPGGDANDEPPPFTSAGTPYLDALELIDIHHPLDAATEAR